jgi:hypothetical protein
MPLEGPFMDADRFDGFTSRIASGMDRRRALLRIVAGAAGFFAFEPNIEAKKRRRKKRCKPRRLQAVCQSNKQCCTKKTGRVCAPNARGGACNLDNNVCCLPIGAAGCRESCDCCGGVTVLCLTEQIGQPGRCTSV